MPTKITTLTVNELGQAAAIRADADAAAASASAAAASAAAAAAAENSLLEWQGPWVTATAYAPSDLVEENGNTYVCVTAHTSGTFSTDLGSAYWELFAAKGDTGPGTGDMLGSNNLSDVANATTSRFNLGLTEAVVTTTLASQVEAETGTDNTKLVTPLRVAQRVTSIQSSQAEAEAGTDNTKLMTPLRTAQAIAALQEAGGITLLGTLDGTGGGSTLTLSGLDLTPYKKVEITFEGMSHSSGINQALLFEGVGLLSNTINAAAVARGIIQVYLATGELFGLCTATATATKETHSATSISTATTSLSFTIGSGPFDAGNFYIYGVK